MRKLRLVVFIMGKYQLAIFPPPLIARALPQQHFKITYPLMHFIVQFSLQYREKPSNVCHNYPKGTSDRQRPQMKNAFASLMFPTVTPHCPFPHGPFSLSLLSLALLLLLLQLCCLIGNSFCRSFWSCRLRPADSMQINRFPMRGEGGR